MQLFDQYSTCGFHHLLCFLNLWGLVATYQILYEYYMYRPMRVGTGPPRWGVFFFLETRLGHQFFDQEQVGRNSIFLIMYTRRLNGT